MNTLPSVIGIFIALCVKMKGGLTALASELGITQITPKQFGQQVDGLKSSQNKFEGSRSAKQAASDEMKPADTAVSDFIMTARNAFIKSFGTRWNTMWAQAGWTDRTTAVPRKVAQQRTLIDAIAAFLTDNPSYEVPPLNVTAKEAANLYKAAVAADEKVVKAKTAQGTAKDTRAADEKAMRKSARMLIGILKGVLADNDPRWETFGLQMPANKMTPGQPVNVVAYMDPTGAVRVNCDAVPLADRYRFRSMIVGAERDYRLAASSLVPTALLKKFMPGDTLRIIAQAVNGNSQGVASEPIEFTVPAAAKPETVAAPSPAAETAAATPAVAHVNGTNGHGRRNRVTV